MDLFEDFLDKPVKELVTNDKAYIRVENNPTLYICKVIKTGHKKITVEYNSPRNKIIQLEFDKNDGRCIDRKRDYGKYKLYSENHKRNVIYNAQQEYKTLKSKKYLLENRLRTLYKILDDRTDTEIEELVERLEKLKEINKSLIEFLGN